MLDDKIYSLIFYNDRNLVAINFTEKIPKMEQYRRLNQLSGRLSGLNEKSSLDCFVDNRKSRTEDNIEFADFDKDSFTDVSIYVVDTFVEKDLKSRDG